MKINLLRDYCGRIINDQTLLKGVQDVADSVGAYLVGKGYAVAIDSEPLPQAVEVDSDVAKLPEIDVAIVNEPRTFTPKRKR
jgi:hypothetical protein